MPAAGTLIVTYLVLQRLAELTFAASNTSRLLAGGGIEVGRGHYPLLVLLHLAWLAGLAVFAHDRSAESKLLAAFILLQMGRLWVIATLGPRWTTRIIVVPGERLVRRGPYRVLRHPNYLIVILELAVVPLALGLPLFAAVFTGLNGALLLWRIRVENAALRSLAR